MRWSFYIESREVFPLNQRELKIKKYLENEYIRAYRKSLSGDIVLMGSDYAYLKTLESGYKDEKFTFEIKESDVLHFSGEFTIYDCTFDDYKKTVSIKITQRDEYTAIQENEDIKVNIIGEKSYITADIYSYWHFFVGSAEGASDQTYAKCILSDLGLTTPGTYYNLYVTECIVIDSGQSAPSGWEEYADLGDFIIYQRFPVDYAITYTADNLAEVDTSDIRWSGVLGYRKPYDESLYTYYKYPYTREDIDFGDIWIMKSAYNGRANAIFTQTYVCYELQDVLNKILETSAPDFTGTVKSGFLFDDTLDRTEPNFYATRTIYDKYLIEMSDFKKPSASKPTTIGYITFKQAIEYLCDKHNLRWFIDSDGDLRIEHITYFENASIKDISSLELNTKYSYLQNEKTNREYISESSSYNEDFAQVEVLYGTVPALEGVKENTKNKVLSTIYTDIDGFNTHLDQVPSEGFLYIDVSSGEVVNTEAFITGATIQNGSLSNGNVLNESHRHNAYQNTFYIGGIEVTAQSLKRMKKHEIEFMGIPDTSKDLVTAIGRGQIEYIEYALTEEERVKAEVHYE